MKIAFTCSSAVFRILILLVGFWLTLSKTPKSALFRIQKILKPQKNTPIKILYFKFKGVFSWYLLFSVDNSRILKPVDFAGKVCRSRKNGPSDFGRFRWLQLKIETLKPSCHKENTSEQYSLLSKSVKPSSSRSRRFGKPSKPTVFGKQYQKNRIFKPTKNVRQPAEKRRYQKNTP